MNHVTHARIAVVGVRPRRPVACAVLLSAACLALGACRASAPVAAPSSEAGAADPSTAPASVQATSPGAADSAAPATPSASASASAGTTVPGYALGEAPPVPLFTLPDMGLLTADRGSLTSDQTAAVDSVPGVTVSPARCDQAGSIYLGSTSTVLTGNGGVASSDATGSVVNNGDGSGSYKRGSVSIVNNGDGTGTYSDGSLSILNRGDGTALVNGQSTAAKPLSPVGKVGSFPSIDAIKPVQSCGTAISLDAGILFDVDSYQIRPESNEVLASLARVLSQAGAPKATVAGHTDSVADDAYNQTLSEQRAQAVVDALRASGATSTQLTAVGYGETQPVAPNTAPDGSDDPAGRQLNRRVEIMIPVF